MKVSIKGSNGKASCKFTVLEEEWTAEMLMDAARLLARRALFEYLAFEGDDS